MNSLNTNSSTKASQKLSEDPDLFLSQLGVRIVRRREELGLTQRSLAAKLGMAQGNVNRIEYGRQNLTIRTVFRLAEALEMPVAELLSGLTGMPEPPKRP
ncbi:MAG: helix-turn-helix transcriptional regulator [Minicystis sp.]